MPSSCFTTKRSHQGASREAVSGTFGSPWPSAASEIGSDGAVAFDTSRQGCQQCQRFFTTTSHFSILPMGSHWYLQYPDNHWNVLKCIEINLRSISYQLMFHKRKNIRNLLPIKQIATAWYYMLKPWDPGENVWSTSNIDPTKALWKPISTTKVHSTSLTQCFTRGRIPGKFTPDFCHPRHLIHSLCLRCRCSTRFCSLCLKWRALVEPPAWSLSASPTNLIPSS